MYFLATQLFINLKINNVFFSFSIWVDVHHKFLPCPWNNFILLQFLWGLLRFKHVNRVSQMSEGKLSYYHGFGCFNLHRLQGGGATMEPPSLLHVKDIYQGVYVKSMNIVVYSRFTLFVIFLQLMNQSWNQTSCHVL